MRTHSFHSSRLSRDFGDTSAVFLFIAALFIVITTIAVYAYAALA